MFPSVINLLGNAGITWKYYSGVHTDVEGIWHPPLECFDFKQTPLLPRIIKKN
jgi:hypothetical protein